MNDLRFAFRQLLKNPGFTAVTVLTLALGIGANTAIFTVVNALLLRSLPVRAPKELVQASVAGIRNRDHSFSYPAYEQLRDASKHLSGLFAAGNVGPGRMAAPSMGGSETELIRAQPVSGNFFSVLGVEPFLGRLITDADDLSKRAERVVVINYGFWQRRFGGDASVIGKSITFFDVPVTIVGVTVPGFFGFQPGENPDLWWPINLVPQVDQDVSAQRLGEGNDWLRLIGRLSPGVDARAAEAELEVAFQRYRAGRAAVVGAKLSAEERRRIQQDRLELQPAGNGWTRLRDKFRQPLLIMMAIVGLVLLVACANVAGLILARGTARTREFSIRAALGAQRSRLIRQQLTESFLLAALGGGLGLLVAQWGAQALVSFAGLRADLVSFNLRADTQVLSFTMGLSMITSLVFGLVPALRGSRADFAATIKGTGGIGASARRSLLQQSLVVAQVAMSLLLLVGAGLFVRTLGQLKGMDMGFLRENILVFQVGFKERINRAHRISAYKELLRQTEAMPDVRSVSMSLITPLSDNGWGQRLNIEGYVPGPDEVVRCNGMSVARRYFETLGTPLISGRDFKAGDERVANATATNAPGVAIINETMARQYFGNTSALGRRFSFFASPDRKFEIVGIVKDAKYRSLRDPAPPTFYVFCFDEVRDWDMTFAVRTTKNPSAIIDFLRRALRETDPALELGATKTMDDVVNASVQRERIIATLGGFFSLAALSLACLGIYGTLSFAVAQRTREIGLRMALGARRHDVLWLVVGKGLKLVLVGGLIGIIAALALTRIVASMLWGVGPNDPLTISVAMLLLMMVATLASAVPARLATKIDPLDALRHE